MTGTLPRCTINGRHYHTRSLTLPHAPTHSAAHSHHHPIIPSPHYTLSLRPFPPPFCLTLSDIPSSTSYRVPRPPSATLPLSYDITSHASRGTLPPNPVLPATKLSYPNVRIYLPHYFFYLSVGSPHNHTSYTLSSLPSLVFMLFTASPHSVIPSHLIPSLLFSSCSTFSLFLYQPPLTLLSPLPSPLPMYS